MVDSLEVLFTIVKLLWELFCIVSASPQNVHTLGTVHILRNQEGWVGGVGQMITLYLRRVGFIDVV